MVLRVCRGVLADPHDTQDAFQATFLVLVRRPAHSGCGIRWALGCIRWPTARLRVPGRRSPVGGGTNDARPGPRDVVGAEPADELERLLHDEIDRLPERYRAPVVLCDLEGQSHEQAARHLGWPVGTVKSRLSRGRERLRSRLLKSGVTPNAGLIATALSSDGPTLLDPSRPWCIPRPTRRLSSLRLKPLSEVLLPS